ncbi:4308_t:CDS:2 [Acaulospora colombiana]|uniref:4308_t:CDS:1 n=1 Tax=Acaulospora colombiana TaxID=27376 RepID=A0ACA9M1Y0_9GLOM|nr:4308_t:CDS:2 [Acaulospora colombiana]
MGRVRRDSLATTEEIIDGKAIFTNSKDSFTKFKDSSFVNNNVVGTNAFSPINLSHLLSLRLIFFKLGVDGRWIQCDNSSRSSGSSHKKLKTSNGSVSRITPPPFEPSAPSEDHDDIETIEVEKDQTTLNLHDNISSTDINELPKRQTCKFQKNGISQKLNNNHNFNDNSVTVSNGNGHGGRKEKRTSFVTTTTTDAELPILFHPYNWSHPVSYNRALHRVAQIREFILTHCPAAASSSPLSSSSVNGVKVNGIGIDVMEDIVENTNFPESSIRIAIDLWNKLERLEKSYNKKKPFITKS